MVPSEPEKYHAVQKQRGGKKHWVETSVDLGAECECRRCGKRSMQQRNLGSHCGYKWLGADRCHRVKSGVMRTLETQQEGMTCKSLLTRMGGCGVVQEMFRVHAGAFGSEALEPMQPAAVQKKTHLSKGLGTGKQHPGRKGMEPLTEGKSGSPERPKEEFYDGWLEEPCCSWWSKGWTMQRKELWMKACIGTGMQNHGGGRFVVGSQSGQEAGAANRSGQLEQDPGWCEEERVGYS